MDEDSWESARLIPVSGISGADEQERRGVSALLAVLASVRPVCSRRRAICVRRCVGHGRLA
jgi:hypothetical protein